VERIFRDEKKLSEIESGQADSDWQNEHLTFQWDERNLLVSLKGNFASTNETLEMSQGPSILRGISVQEGSGTDVLHIAEKRYEYDLDDQGNWTEHREIFMIRLGDYLFPSQGLTMRRIIQYIP
jgi:hypothetical protein